MQPSDYNPIEFWERFRVLLAGCAGGVTVWLAAHLSTRDGLAAVIVGGIVALAFDPLTIPIISQFTGASPTVGEGRLGSMLAAFLVGVCGIAIVRWVISKFRAYSALTHKDDDPPKPP